MASSQNYLQYYNLFNYFSGLGKYNNKKTDIYNLKRISINDDFTEKELAVKVSGIWGFIKKIL